MRFFHPGRHREVVVVCLPHAGGSASFYREWGAHVPEEFEVGVIQYPGREDRLGEPCVDDMTVMADTVTAALRPYFASSVVLFGHSMGAAVMYEVARRCEAEGLYPDLLVASGQPAPHCRGGRVLHRDGDEALIAELRRFSETSEAVLRSTEMRELMLPAMRADYKLIETYEPGRTVRLRTPLAVFRGLDDPEVNGVGALRWRELTVGGELYAHRVFEGGHFYLREHRDAVLTAMTGLVREVCDRHGPPRVPNTSRTGTDGPS